MKNNSTCFTVFVTDRVCVHGGVTVPIYNARSQRLTVRRDCLIRSSNTRAFSQLSSRVLFTLAVNNDDGSN